MFSGHATASGTARYRDRLPKLRDAGHFRSTDGVPQAGDLWLSSIGLGTYLGEPDEAADRDYTDAIAAALRSGINVLDTAINYRHQRSERNIGAALKHAIDGGELQRDEVLVCTKAGYLSFDGNLPANPREYFLSEYVKPGILDPEKLVGGMHCMAPAYLENQVERSRRNLGLETLDVFYLHNPETQLSEVSRPVFYERVKDAFALLERQVSDGKVRYYGMATWNGFRAPHTAREHLNLFEIVRLAREVGGDGHHFRFIQLPFNLAMPEAYALANQISGQEEVSVLAAAASLGVAVVGSATLYQGRLTQDLPNFVGRTLGTKTAGEGAIQFARSALGVAVALIGMGHAEHVKVNLRAALLPPTRLEAWQKLFSEK